MATPLPIGTSEGVRAVMRQVEKIAQSDAPVLIQGETGSGKELVARAIWSRSPRWAGPFVPINCGAIPDGLIETELFGHGAGAFTDAKHARDGVIAQARHGTLFLDEINTLSPRAQVTLLRFLQDLRYRPVGTSTERAADVRVIAASNQPLQDIVAAGHFRQDLLYRLNILELTIPPLRSRLDDIELLVDHFLRLFCRKYGLPPKRLHPDASEWLRQHQWPGNVRELENWIHREVLLADGDEIRAGCHPMACSDRSSDRRGGAPTDYRAAKARALAEFESAYLSQALAAAHGNVTVAARMAGKERRSFGKLLRKHGIDRFRFRS
ncbi:MAG TPA: sigma-54 dependent transcriptional regulator [Vicinamibacterales bacterium]